MVTEKLIALIAEKLDIDPTEITADSKLTELGMDSLDIAELLWTSKTISAFRSKSPLSLFLCPTSRRRLRRLSKVQV